MLEQARALLALIESLPPECRGEWAWDKQDMFATLRCRTGHSDNAIVDATYIHGGLDESPLRSYLASVAPEVLGPILRAFVELADAAIDDTINNILDGEGEL